MTVWISRRLPTASHSRSFFNICSMLQLTRPLAIIDLETTGVNLGSDRIVEIAIVKIMPDGKKIVKRKLINPEMPIPQSSIDIHGITNEMLKDAPNFRQVA